jgi:small GTP-binding protein
MALDLDTSKKMKVVVIGGPNVGKTSIISAYVSGAAEEAPAQTVQLAFSQKDEQIGDVVVHLQICDTAGQERFQSVCPNFYRDAQGALVVFDVTAVASFQKIHVWIDELNATMPESFIVIVVGNKTDLSDERVVTREEAVEFASFNSVSYLETSAVTGHGIQTAFQMLCEKFLELEGPKDGTFVPNQVVLTDEPNVVQKQSCCQ